MAILKYLKSFETFENKEYTDAQKNNAHDLFICLFDMYLRKVSPKTYPMIYHCTDFKHYDSIKTFGLNKKRNYFLDNNNDYNIYGFDDDGNEVPGIACGVDFSDVKERLFPDPECIPVLWTNVPSPHDFDKLGYDDKIMCCVLMELLDIDLNSDIDDISSFDITDICESYMFNWIYVKGEIKPNKIEIIKHSIYT